MQLVHELADDVRRLQIVQAFPRRDGVQFPEGTQHGRQMGQGQLPLVAGALLAVQPLLVQGKRLLLIDDVITTGATMAAASAELKRAGAAAVDGLAIARVW